MVSKAALGSRSTNMAPPSESAARWSELTEWWVWIWVTDTSSQFNIKSRVFPTTCVDRLTCWIKLNCSIKALSYAAFTSGGSLIRKLKSPTITCLPDKESSTPVSSLNWSLKSDEDVPLGTRSLAGYSNSFLNGKTSQRYWTKIDSENGRFGRMV